MFLCSSSQGHSARGHTEGLSTADCGSYAHPQQQGDHSQRPQTSEHPAVLHRTQEVQHQRHTHQDW